MEKIVNPKLYRPRIIDGELDECLRTFGAVCIEGPRGIGKSWTASYHSGSECVLQNPAGNFNTRALAEADPQLVLEGDAPRLIDEWQDVPALWDAVRYEVDRRGEPGQFILTGSLTPKNLRTRHSGIGRIEKLRMDTMSLYETGDSTGEVSLKSLFEGKLKAKLTGDVKLIDLLRLLIRGGWPENLSESADPSRIPKSYVNRIIDWDTQNSDNVRYDTLKTSLILRSLARNESTTASLRTIGRDITTDQDYFRGKNQEKGYSPATIDRYLGFLRRLFVTDDIPPFAINMRAPERINLSEKLHFCDVSLASACLDATEDKLMGDLRTAGFLFESLCEHDLKIYARASGGKLYHYRDYTDHEMDAVVELEDGRWYGFEIKLGAGQIPAAAENLLKVSSHIERCGGRAPEGLCVICGLSGGTYRREDGVFVVPITSLGP